MNRRHFLHTSGLAAGSLLLPEWSRAATDLANRDPVSLARKKQLADAALNAATKAGASYADVRIGRYLNQVVTTREDRVENVAMREPKSLDADLARSAVWSDRTTATTSGNALTDAVT